MRAFGINQRRPQDHPIKIELSEALLGRVLCNCVFGSGPRIGADCRDVNDATDFRFQARLKECAGCPFVNCFEVLAAP